MRPPRSFSCAGGRLLIVLEVSPSGADRSRSRTAPPRRRSGAPDRPRAVSHTTLSSGSRSRSARAGSPPAPWTPRWFPARKARPAGSRTDLPQKRGTYYTYVRAREIVGGIREDVALTPHHSAGIVGVWEREDASRVGVEWYYTGVQRLEENPSRERSEPYVVVGLLAERQFGSLRNQRREFDRGPSNAMESAHPATAGRRRALDRGFLGTPGRPERQRRSEVAILNAGWKKRPR